MRGKLWGGRFGEATHPSVDAFGSSLGIDSRLWQADIRGSIAHAQMLGRTGIVPQAEAEQIAAGLSRIEKKLAAGETRFDPSAEDVHSEIERLLREEIGTVAGKLHTARSRNDQVATATRLYLRGEIDALVGELKSLQTWLVDAAEKHIHTVLPGFTHLQHAQPVSLAHHLLAYFWMLRRDRERLGEIRARVNRLPLGSAALAGTSFPIDRKSVAQALGFDGITENSLDAVSDRDFAVEFLSAGALILTHLSRLSEELILWSTPEFGFIEMSDTVTTGSSIMPQKKNPDMAELIRGRTGRLTGALMGSLTMLKGLPLSYNRDLQEDKVHLFEGLDTTRACVRIMTLMLSETQFRKERMESALKRDFSNATDLADYLVRQGMPFRDAHEVVGHVVRTCLEKGVGLEDLSAAELSAFHPTIGAECVILLKHRAVMEARTSEGGTAPSAVQAQILAARAKLTGGN